MILWIRLLNLTTLNVSCCYSVHVQVFPSCIFLCAPVPPGSLSVLRFLLMRHFVLHWNVLSLLLDLVLVIGSGDLPPFPLPLGGLGVYSAGDVLKYAFLASRLQSASLQTKLLHSSGIVTAGPPLVNSITPSVEEKDGMWIQQFG